VSVTGPGDVLGGERGENEMKRSVGTSRIAVWLGGLGRLDVTILRVVKVGNVLARNEVELAALDHEAGKVAHDWLSLYMQIAEHHIGAPAAE
jgi:hypothetical protein